MSSPNGLSLPVPSLRARLQARLSELGQPELEAWIPQPGPACSLAGEAGAPELERVSVSGGDALLEAYLEEVQVHWETALAAHARQLALAQAVHGLSNALTPLLCDERLTTEEQARVTWRSETLRHLARGAETSSPCAAGPFLRNLQRSLEHAGVEVELEVPAALEARPLTPEEGHLRDRLIEAALAAHQERGSGPAPVLRLSSAGERLSLSLEAGPEVLFSRRGQGAVEVEREPERTRLTWLLPRPWLAWLGPPPRSSEALERAGIGLLVIPSLERWEAAWAARPEDFAERPLGVALGGPRREHALLKRELLERDLRLARACYSAASWPRCEIPEVVDVAAWCRAQSAP